jgi:hypothetical protein
MKLGQVVCLPCVATYHGDCAFLDVEANDCCCSGHDLGGNHKEGFYKSDDEVTDPKSTGRKRAAVLYPIEPGTPCEWKGLKFAGGGVFPIIGCVLGTTVARHHGPDKNTLNNSEGNVHRICADCHNRWHTLNDPLYANNFNTETWKGHDSKTKATSEELALNEMRWNMKPAERVVDE